MASRSSSSDQHAHGCTRCHGRYVDSCDTRAIDALCVECRKGPGAGWQLLINNRKPKDCCRAHSRLTTKEEKARYSLAGTSPWFICGTCARTHPTDPTRK